MSTARQAWRRFKVHVVGGLAVPLLLPLGAGAADPAPVETPPAATATPPAAATVTAQSLTLDECLQIARERQPSIAAARASLAAAQDGLNAIQNLRAPDLIVHELPYRRKQACLGVTVASAGLSQAERETDYAVARTYFSVLYARAQRRVSDSVVENLQATEVIAKPFTKARGGVTENTIDRIRVYIRLAELRQYEADRGAGRAVAALREAIGYGPEFEVQVPAGRLPEPDVDLTKDTVVSLAVANRGEIVQAATLAQITCIEVDAQGASHHKQFHTFAAGSDIHARPVPEGLADGDYRPGALAPEMPPFLVGNKADRVERARDLYARATAVADKTRNLITLEAEDAYYKYEEAKRRVAKAREAARLATRVADTTRADLRDLGPEKVKIEDAVGNDVLAATARGQYNEALFNLIVSLINIERVTGGAYRAGLQPLPPAAEPAPNGGNNGGNGAAANGK